MMQQLKFAEIFSSRRKQLRMTQGEVAAYVGVSNAAVSKWEQGLSYPELTLLPRLATLMDLSIDALLGYNPQLTRKKINEHYAAFANRFRDETFDKVQADIEKLLLEYYSCYPLLVQMSQLYLNYYTRASDQAAVLNRIAELSERVISYCDDYKLTHQARMIQAYVLLLTGKPQELLTILGDKISIQYGEEFLIAKAHEMLGDQDKAKLVVQVSMYQYMIVMITSATESLALEAADREHFDETVNRIEQMLQLFQVEQLNPNLSLTFYFNAAAGYMKQQREADALRMLEQYYRACRSMKFPLQLRGDAYFYLIDEWIAQEIFLGAQAPRDEESIKQDIVNLLLHNPSFAPLQDDPAFQAIITNLKHVLKLKEDV